MRKSKKEEQKINIWDIAAYLFVLIFFIAGTLVSLNRFWQYEVYYYDFGIFDRAIWLVSRFQAPIIDHITIGTKWIFADHFSPSIFLLSPIFWFTAKSEALLVAQALAVALSGLVIYLIGKDIIKNKFQSLSILVCYFLFVGLQNALITDFHEITVATLFVTLTFLAFLKKKTLVYILLFVLTLGFKESFFLIGITLSITTVLIRREWFKISLITLLLSIIWGLASIKLIIPHFSGGFYLYETYISNNPLDFLKSLVDQNDKIRTIFYSFFSFGFLPLASPLFWPVFLADFLTRFYPPFPTRWTLAFHYNAVISPFLAISSFYALKYFSNFKINYSHSFGRGIFFLRFARFTFIPGINGRVFSLGIKKILPLISALLILNALFLYRFPLNGPLGLSYNKAFYKHTNNFLFLEELLSRVPKEASVMTHNNLASHFTHQQVWLLRSNYESFKPDYIVIDAREGQSINDFFNSPPPEQILPILKEDNKYELVYTTIDQFIFKRK